MSTNLHSHRHCVYQINLHIVFVTKYRRKVITADILKRLEDIFSHLCQNQKSELIKFSGEPDHVHLLVDFSPDVAPSRLVNTLKTISSRMIRKEFAEHINKFYWNLYSGQCLLCYFRRWSAVRSSQAIYPKSNEPEKTIP
jgi:putative transposase